MLINFSNHPSQKWSEKQLQEARKFGEIIDLPFPDVDPNYNESEINQISIQYIQKIIDISHQETCTVHIMGEMTLTFTIINKLKNLNYSCIASTTKRSVNWLKQNEKSAHFSFVRFREYNN